MTKPTNKRGTRQQIYHSIKDKIIIRTTIKLAIKGYKHQDHHSYFIFLVQFLIFLMHNIPANKEEHANT